MPGPCPVAAIPRFRAIGKGAMINSAFWLGKAQRFAALRDSTIRKSERPLDASFHPGGWGFGQERAFEGHVSGRWLLCHGTPQIYEDYKSVAALCAVALGAPNNDSSWAEWLEYLRRDSVERDSVEFEQGDVVMESRHIEWRDDPSAEVVATGLLYVPHEATPDRDPEIVSAKIGEIDDVCAASERLCRRLADECEKRELSEATQRPARLLEANHDAASSSESDTAAIPRDLISIEDAAQICGMNYDSVYKWIKAGALQSFKVGPADTIRVRQRDVERLIRRA
jgi:hypothetical protein